MILLAISLLQIDIGTGSIEKRQWDDAVVVPIGSLAKPFIALAYAQRHNFEYPRLRCKRCWKPDGHGQLDITQAIAQSCNAYFEILRSEIPSVELDATAARFGLPNVDSASPEAILKAYIELERRAAEPGVGPILRGMREAASHGTAKALQKDALAKTGTAACRHTPKAPGDGFVVVLHPAVQPRTAYLVRVHGRPGSEAARVARGFFH